MQHYYRHQLGPASMGKLNLPESAHLQKELALIPVKDQQPIAQIWSSFATASPQQRLIILQGLLSTCCTSQLSFLSDAIQPFLRLDLTTVLPTEICIKIFTYLDAQSLCAAAQVSRRWKTLADDDSLWHRMCEQHIDKKCAKCGWGLPLLQKRKILVQANKRPREEDFRDSRPSKRLDRRLWKDVYSERLVVERNWRKNKSTNRVLKGHSAGVTCLQSCDAQNILVTGSSDKTVMVWDLGTGEVLRTLKGHTRSVRTLQFDGTKLVTGSMDHTLRIWNYHSGKCIRTLEGHTAGVIHLHFNSQILASGSADHTVRVWNFAAGECYTLTGHLDAVNNVRIHQHSNYLLSSSDDGTIRVWDLERRTCNRVLQGHLGSVQTAIPSMPGFLHQFDNGVTETKLVQDASSGEVSERRSEDDGRCGRSSMPVVISGSLDNTIKIWSFDNGSCLRTLFGHTHGISVLDYDKLRLVSGSRDGSIKIWDIESGLPMHTMQAHKSAIHAVALSDTKLISASADGEIRICDFGVKFN
ncbi:hypothetical protein DFQ28_004966 [Apophysomyces sp. BC1034]|nr:hypothetical protein DFQ30_002967 [Apophysomyces sp. BC1015]KAG0180125.1 hypothetical protein DFQ29_001187 [Apophysomyces sp. BC1021]KAG0188340.1 hypothetical protein DFQ28_004966 [Apophysomyces sp. BC1034]